MNIRFPVYQPSLTGREKEYVNDCLDTTWISSKGKYIQQFEQQFSSYVGCHHGAAVSNGTVGLHLALLALGIGPGDEVIVPTLTYIASVNAIRYTGATPVFCDSNAADWTLSIEDAQSRITTKTKAIMAVHLYGQPCAMDELTDLCKSHDLFLIEDCAESIGSTYKGKMTGSFGHIAVFSFFGNKTITTGEGGMVLTSDAALYERCFHLKGQGLAKNREYWHDVVGYNYRMTNICAAIGLAQLEQVNTFIEKKQQIACWYQEALKGSTYEFHQPAIDVFHTYWMCSILLPEASQRDAFRAHLSGKGIETRPLFFPVHTMPIYDEGLHFPVAENLGARGVNLPSYPGLSKEDVEFICEAILSFQP